MITRRCQEKFPSLPHVQCSPFLCRFNDRDTVENGDSLLAFVCAAARGKVSRCEVRYALADTACELSRMFAVSRYN